MCEIEFLNLCKEILEEGEFVQDRTKTGIRYLFSPQTIRYNLTETIPCFTTKKIAWQNTIKELLWFISGSSDSLILEQQGCNWWKGNTTREFLDSRGLYHLPVGNIGKMYGYQWKKNNQLGKLIENIKSVKNGDFSNSRRLMMTAYVPEDLDQGVLEPCHTFIQCNVSQSKYLDLTLYQRSADMFLGAQINILSYSIFTCMLADVCGLQPRYFYHHLGNSHIYNNHIDQMQQQIARIPGKLPKLTINHRDSIDDYVFSDFNIVDYNPQSAIKGQMAV